MMEVLFAQESAALLPSLLWQQWGLSLGWAVVVAGLAVWLMSRQTSRTRIQALVAAGLAIWVLCPGPWGGAYWLGLAFQAPSLTTVLLCACLCGQVVWRPEQAASVRSKWSPQALSLAVCGVVLGWILLLDTLGVFSGSLYHWGFGSAAPAVALAGVALPWVLAKERVPAWAVVLLGLSTVLFMVSRLPTGNLFDALIDPALWCFLHGALLQQWRQRSDIGAV